MFVKVTYAQTIEFDEVSNTNDLEEEELNEVIVTYYPEELDDCDPDSDYYDDCYCDPESCYGEDDEYYYPEEEELDDCDPDSNNYVECDCDPENCEDTQTQEQENCNKTCPDSQTLNTVSCTCENKPNKNWYQDLDNDGYHSATKSYYKSPGTGWKPGVSIGPDCDDMVHADINGNDCREDCPEKTNGGTTPEGKVIAVYFQGSPFGGGEDVDPSDAGFTGDRFDDLKSLTENSGKDFKGEVIAPGYTATSGVDNGGAFITENYKPGDQVIIYGYSWGGDLAVELSEFLNSSENEIPVNLLITVDAADGPLGNITVDTTIPDNVSVNLNIYQTTGSGVGSGSSSDDGTSPGSNGGPNSADDSTSTTVINKDITADEVTHRNIQDTDEAKEFLDAQIDKHIKGCKK